MVDKETREGRVIAQVEPFDLSWMTTEDTKETFAPPKQPPKFLDEILAEIKKGP